MKKKISLFLLLIISVIAIFAPKVDAEIIKYRRVYDNNELDTNFNVIQGSETTPDCGGIFTKEALDLISDVLGWIRILAPAVLLLMIGVDFGSAVLLDDNDALKKASSRVVKRCLAAVGLFFVPAVVRLLLNLPGVRDTIQIPSDPLCGTMDSIVVENEVLVK